MQAWDLYGKRIVTNGRQSEKSCLIQYNGHLVSIFITVYIYIFVGICQRIIVLGSNIVHSCGILAECHHQKSTYACDFVFV